MVRRKRKVKNRRINYNQIGDIFAKAVYDDAWRKKLLASPEATLEGRRFKPHPAAIALIKSLKSAKFERAAKKFKPMTPLAKPSRET